MNIDSKTLATLWENAKPNLNEQELKAVADLGTHARFLAGNLASIVEGIGCLVLSDDGPGTKAGNFHSPDDVSTLLFSISNQIDHINGLLFISNEANYRMKTAKTESATEGAQS